MKLCIIPIFIKNVVAVAAYSRLTSLSQVKFHTKKLSPLVRPCAEHHIRPSFTRRPKTKIEDSCGCLWSSSAGLRWKFGQVGSVWNRVFTSLSAVSAWTKWRSDHVTGRLQLNPSLSFLAVGISVVGMTTIFAANNAAWIKGNHFVLKTDAVSFAKTGCLSRGLRKPRPTLRRHDARLQRRRRQPRKPVKRPWTIPWRSTLRKRPYNYLPSVPSPRDRPRRNGRKPKPQHLNPLNQSPWLPASWRWDGPALTGRSAAGLGVQSAREDTGTTNDRILRDTSRHGLTAAGERASGPCQVPQVVPAPGDVSSPAVSPRRQTLVRRPLPLIIVIIPREIVVPFHQLHLGHLPTAGHRPVTTREDERAPIGRVRRTSPDEMWSCRPRYPTLLRRERSRWSLRQPGRFMLNRPQKTKSRHWWQMARQVLTRRQATAGPQVTARQHATAWPQATTRPHVTARPQVTMQAPWKNHGTWDCPLESDRTEENAMWDSWSSTYETLKESGGGGGVSACSYTGTPASEISWGAT